MTTLSSYAGLCFRASRPIASAAVPEGSELINPWPLHAPRELDRLDDVLTQPLIRCWYSPTPLPDFAPIVGRRRRARAGARPSRQALDDLNDWYVLLHEGLHLWLLERTPAKELAKLYLARIYAGIYQLLFTRRLSKRRAKMLWGTLNSYTAQLDAIWHNIAHVEEIVSTALSLQIMSSQTKPGGMWDGMQGEVDVLRRHCLATQERTYRGFTERSHHFQPLAEALYANTALRALVIPLLQPVVRVSSQQTPLPADSVAHLDALAQLYRRGGYSGDMMRKIDELHRELLVPWKQILATNLTDATSGTSDEGGTIGYFAAALWQLAHRPIDLLDGSDVVEQATNAIAWYRRSMMTEPEEIAPHAQVVAELWPHLDRGQWFIRCALTHFSDYDYDRSNNRSLVQHNAVLTMEALRQQLSAGKGIICPLSTYGAELRCRCKEGMREAMERLAALAHAGVFGKGEWLPLPCGQVR